MRRLAVVPLVLALLEGSLAVPARGDPETRRDVETIVVTGSNQPWAIADLPGSVDVISGEEIEADRYDSVLEVVRRVPGLHADQPGARGARASVYTRGLDPNHTLVLIDGIIVNDPTNARGGSFDFSTLGTDDIERIEIVRGPLSAVHGSDAVGGAINIITRDGKGRDEISGDLSGGRWGYFRGYGRLSGERGPLDLALTGSYVDESDPSKIGDYRGGALNASVGLDLPTGIRTRGTLRFSDSRNVAFPEFSGGKELAVIRQRERRDIEELAAGLTVRQTPVPRFEYALRGSVYTRHEDRMSPGVAPSAGDPFGIPAEPHSVDRLRRYELSALGTARAPFSISLTAGGDATWESGASSGALVSPFFSTPTDFDLDRVVGGPFAEAHWDSGWGLVLLAGVRADFPDGGSAEVTPRVSGAYALPGLPDGLALEVVGSWGQGFKLPSFFALGNPLVGNPALRSERSQGGDAGVTATLWEGRLEARVSYFDITVRNLIDFNADPSIFALENLGRVRSRGVEMGARARPVEGVEIDAQITYADTRDEDTGRRLRNRPRWRGGISLGWKPLDSLNVGIRTLFVGDVLDTSVPTAPAVVTLESYERIDLAISWAPRDWVEVYLAVDNLLDADFEEAVGFPAVGIRPRAGVRMRLAGRPPAAATGSAKALDTW